MTKLIMAALVSVVFMPLARAATVENDLFVCTGELIKHGPNDYSIKETGRKDEDYPMECFIDKGKILQQVLSVCRVKDVCVVSAKGESSNRNEHFIQKVFEVQRSRQTVEDFKSMESQ